MIGLLIFCTALIFALNANYNRYYDECIDEGVLSKFECKQAAHNMAYNT